ncbi:MAG: hypothetical protein LAT78_07480, partial [Roseinatronobacter sp.]|nr:hypothetical protein [Roseinatronobacter sp.]
GATGQQVPRISAPKPAALPDELALCMVGAHMSGLPLNSQVMDRGGRYLETVQLGPDYRLFALSGPEPQRPGLLRETGADSAIEAELWALPLHEVGRFLQSIPAPLGLGSITLSDGRVVQGFLCEAAATLDAKDITASGGWRAWCKQKISSMSHDGLDGKSEAASSA